MSGKNIRLSVYRKWVDMWLSIPFVNHVDSTAPPRFNAEDIAFLFSNENIHQLQDDKLLHQIVRGVRLQILARRVVLGGKIPPSCEETDILSQHYDSRTDCTCTGLYPVPQDATVDMMLKETECGVIRKMIRASEVVIQREDEWNKRNLFTTEKLQKAITELILSHSDKQTAPSFCHGSVTALPEVKAPDRRPSTRYDSDSSTHNRLYPTYEQVKLCADAKYFFAMACGAGYLDEGLLQAIADSGNDVLIGDYCEAADEETIALLQRVGGAAMMFLKLSTLAGVLTDWQFDNHVASTIQFRVLGYYRDHARANIPGGLYGSRMTGNNVHRHIDVAIYIGTMAASVATGAEITEKEYMRLTSVCSLINDLIDFRSDTMRKQRENTVLRGIRGCICRYLDGLISSCVEQAYDVIQSSPLSAIVVMSFCNWAVMASHHKLYELVRGMSTVKSYPTCKYASVTGGRYQQLLKALAVYSTIGDDGPRVTKTRAEMDAHYYLYRSSPKSHLAWLADSARNLLNPVTLRTIVDVVHFVWQGEIGDVGYCP
ncbi:hypothetical protein N7510_005953 [Penicillium lagena]|uniref:uncharacterized protein n=1 Tax=Penicillium lagena TaxID=94218 RepID=UPI0025419138|nr:uncharacterized protein N7510_005953 [Penicillium lagena]KAJ5612759.1 hypothetical protein N7510_005953 [Penicillium lagena]